jgi:cell fate regulator YaaT (PSP1 superfamily)
MNRIVDVLFPKYGRVEAFDSGHFVLKKGDKVLVETELGPAFGVVSGEPRNGTKEVAGRPLRKVFRLADQQDFQTYEQNCRLEEEVYDFCYERIKERSLPMILVSADRLFDGSKAMIYFTADGRVDFRELVKDLVQRFRTRIEMRQIGVRHQAKMVGGLGGCGRQLCCTSFLCNFDPVSIKMAKEQNLSLNPTKISGMCGRLMCCLSYEYAYYEQAKKDLPKVGKRVRTTHGGGKVIRQNVLRKKLMVMLDSGEEKEISYEDIVREETGSGVNTHSNGPPPTREGSAE